jgi:FADH2 O2-dependent halogenase
MPATGSRTHDVIVLGTGMAGTTIAAVLARHGADVLMLERHAHPRFAIGESMLPQSALWLWMLGRRFDVEQIGHLSHLDTIMAHVSPRSGLKRTFGFAYHRDGRAADPAQTHRLIPPDLPFVQESHLLREDSDLYRACGVGSGFVKCAAHRHGVGSRFWSRCRH